MAPDGVRPQALLRVTKGGGSQLQTTGPSGQPCLCRCIAAVPPQDCVPQVRGLVTYCGGGTQFLDDRDADRRQLQRLIGSDTGGFRVRRGGTVRQAATGDLLLLKGHSYAGNAGQCSSDMVGGGGAGLVPECGLCTTVRCLHSSMLSCA